MDVEVDVSLSGKSSGPSFASLASLSLDRVPLGTWVGGRRSGRRADMDKLGPSLVSVILNTSCGCTGLI